MVLWAVPTDPIAARPDHHRSRRRTPAPAATQRQDARFSSNTPGTCAPYERAWRGPRRGAQVQVTVPLQNPTFSIPFALRKTRAMSLISGASVADQTARVRYRSEARVVCHTRARSPSNWHSSKPASPSVMHVTATRPATGNGHRRRPSAASIKEISARSDVDSPRAPINPCEIATKVEAVGDNHLIRAPFQANIPQLASCLRNVSR